MPTPGGLPKAGDSIYHTSWPGLEFTVLSRNSRSYPLTLKIARAGQRVEFPPNFSSANLNARRTVYSLLLECALPFAGCNWTFDKPRMQHPSKTAADDRFARSTRSKMPEPPPRPEKGDHEVRIATLEGQVKALEAMVRKLTADRF